MELSTFWILLTILIVFAPLLNGKPVAVRKGRSSISIGPCTWVIDRKCPDIDVQFYLFTRNNLNDRQNVKIDETLEKSNLSLSYFNTLYPTKIIIHGFNSDMFLGPLIKMKDEYLQRDNYNVFFVDWSKLVPGPCYFSAVHNARHAGECIGQLIKRILDKGSANIHLIGFSLGAQVTNFVAQSLGAFVIPRITGLDPAMPLFITASKENKLDASDAAFVDVIHTNALVQGKIEQCGHVDFYMNGGIIQPGCTSSAMNAFACSHHRAPAYFAESIRSYKGFWGWACSSYISYLLGNCPPTNYLVLAGEDCNTNSKGMYLITTNDNSPFALGKWTNNIKKSTYNEIPLSSPNRKHNLLMEHIDEWGKLDSSFNNIVNFPTQMPQDHKNDNWPYFGVEGPNEITNILKNNYDTTTKGNIQIIGDQRTPPKIKRKRKPINANAQTEQTTNILQLYNDEIRQQFLQSYKKNLTAGVIDNETFQYPVLEKY